MSLSRVLLAACLAAILLAGTVAFFRRGDGPQVPHEPALVLGAVHVDGRIAQGDVLLSVAPATNGENWIGVEVDAEAGGPLIDLETVRVRFLPLSAEGDAIEVELALDDEHAGVDLAALGDELYWLVVVYGEASGALSELAQFFLMIPDPNSYPEVADRALPTDPSAESLYLMASTRVSELHRVRYTQHLSDGEGLAVVSFREVNDGSDGSSPGFTYFTPGGLDAVVLDRTVWSRMPGEDWSARETNQMVPPSEWGGEYEGATGFAFGPVITINDMPCRVITFVVPEAERRSVAWYAWCIDEQSGDLIMDGMVSRRHYMLTLFSDFDAEVEIVAPSPRTVDGPNDESS